MIKRDSFILFTSYFENIKDLPDEDKAKLLDAIFLYHLSGDIPKMSPVCQMAFNFMKQDFDRNTEKYEAIVKRNQANGAKGGRPRKNKNPEKPKKPSGFSGNPEKPKKADNDNVDDNVDDNDNVDDSEVKKEHPTPKYKSIIDFYHQSCPAMPKVQKLTDQRKKAIRARIKEYSLEEVQKMLEMAGKSNFLNGSNERNWTADFEWLFKPKNFIKVIEGNYKNTNKKVSHGENRVNNSKEKLLADFEQRIKATMGGSDSGQI